MADEPLPSPAETVRDTARLIDPVELPSGSRVGRYELLEVLGQGGFGITYRARDLELHREVAIKEYLPDAFALRRPDRTVVARPSQSPETFIWGRDRFIEEARILARLERVPGIVNVHDIVVANGTAYMVMEYIRGETLEARLKVAKTLDQRAIERILPPLLDGLELVHDAGFLHRDIKPANIVIDKQGRPWLIDFGAARMALHGRTRAHTAVYTPGYAAFEQSTSAKQGPPADIYALGATLYQTVTGKAPLDSSDRMIEDRLVPAAIAGKDRYAPRLLAGIDAALRLSAADRPQTIEAWRGMLGDLKASAGTGARRWPIWLAAGVVVACVGVAAPFAIDRFRPASDNAAADEATKQAAAKKAADEAAARKAANDAAAKKVADDAAARKVADDAAARKAADDAAARKAADDAAARKAADDAAARKAADDAAARKAADDAAARKAVADTPRPGVLMRDCGDCPEMVRVAAGSFTMGALEGEDVMNAWPPRPIRIPRDWWIGRFPVTVGEYRAFAAAEPFRAGEAWRKLGFPQDDWHPVVNVSWTEALAYVEWLSRTTGASYRLPSEAEWEYAARGGKDGQERYWGDDWDDSGRYMPRRDGKGTVSLKSFAPDGANGAGVIGVLGHVWQWTADCWNGNLKAQPSDGGARDSIGDCKLHIMRGGAWNSSPKLVRTAYRGRGPAVYRSNNLGFRVARTN